MMSRFYFLLWLKWMLRVTLCSVALAIVVSLMITLFIYLQQSAKLDINMEILKALLDIYWFWFVLSWSGTLLIALFRSLKYLFNVCLDGYKLRLLSCDTKELVHHIGYGDLLKVWRKWFMLLIWIVASMMIVSLGITYFLSDYSSVFEWFNIFWLFGFVLISGYFSLILMIAKCKRVELVKC